MTTFSPGQSGHTAEHNRLSGLIDEGRLSESALNATIVGTRPALTGVFGGVLDSLLSGQSASWIHNGNSLWNATDEPIYLTADALGDLAPDAHVMWKVWDDATQDYGAWVTLQAGTDGERCAVFSGTSRTMLTAPANVEAITGDIDVRARVKLADYSTGANQTIFCRYGAAGARAWRIYMNTIGYLVFEWSPDGTNLVSYNTTSAPALTDGQEYWLRATVDVDNGSGGYTPALYMSTDGVTWTTLRTQDVNTGTTGIYDPPGQEYEIGGRGYTGDLIAGSVYEVQIRDGIGGPIVNPQPIDSWVPRSLSGGFPAPTFGGSPTLYVVNGAHPGASISYLADSARLAMLNPPHTSALITFGEMHNEATIVGQQYLALLDSWLAALKARVPGAGFGMTTENPQISPRTIDVIRPQEQRRREVISWAARNAVALVDTWQALLDDGRAMSTLISGDGIHWTTGVSGGAGVASAALLAAFTRRA